MDRTRLMLPSLVLVARKLQLVTAVLVVAFILTEKTICRPKLGVVKLTGEGTKLEGGEHLAPKIRIMSPKEVDRLRNHYIRYEDDEDIPRKGHGFAQQLRSNIVTLDDFRKEMVSDSAMKDRDAFATALGSGERSDNHYFLADLLHNFYLWRKVKGLEAWDESIVLRVKQDLGKRRPEDVMLGDFLDAIFHRDHDHSVSEERFLRWLSRRHFVAEGDEVLLNSKRDKEFYNLEDLIQNYILWARNEDENRIPNGPWIIATLGEPGEKVAGKMMEFVRIKGLLKYRPEEPYLDNLDKKWWSDYLTRPRDDEGYDKASEEVIKKLDKLRKMPFYDQEAVENSMKFLGLNLNPKLFTHLNPDGTPWTPEKKRFFEGLDAKGYPGENTKPSHPSAPYFEPPDQLKKFLYELRTSESYDRKVAEQIIREERGLNIHPKWFTKLKPDGTPEYPEEDAFYRRMEKEEELTRYNHLPKILRPIKRSIDGMKQHFQSFFARLHSLLGIRT